MSLKFNITELNKYQKLAIRKFVLEDKEVFVNLPTGSGKSLIYQGLPVIFDTIFKRERRGTLQRSYRHG
jgi:replicative superfamily II helicase